MPEIEKLIWGGRTRRMRNNIVKFLEEVGSADTRTILTCINNKMSSGATMNQIGNVMAKDPRFIRIGDTGVKSITGASHSLQVFQLAKDYKEWEYRASNRNYQRSKRIQ